ncbi:MAG: hypothetical protein OEV92_12385 [Nitrospinota bacterium]|nr:hypothetical protein [Nitrospinota bacterium]
MKKLLFLSIIPGFFLASTHAFAFPEASALIGKIVVSEAPKRNYPPVPYGAPGSKAMPSFGQGAGSAPRPDHKPSGPNIITPRPPSGQTIKILDKPEEAAKAVEPTLANITSMAPAPLLQAGGELLSAIKMLEEEIKRDNVIAEGEITPAAIDNIRARLVTDLSNKDKVVAALQEKYGSRLQSAIDLIRKTAEMERNLAMSKSSSGEKRRTLQRRIESNIPEKKEALALLKQEVGE